MPEPDYSPRRKLNWKTLTLIIGLHVLALFGLARALAPELTEEVVERATSLVTVTIAAPEEPEVEPDAVPEVSEDTGLAGDPGKDAVAREVVAPPQPRPREQPAPRAASTGNANQSGARDSGDGTGAAGRGDGTGAGRFGSGRGIAVTKPSVKSGQIDSARDFPIPEGGRRVRDGTSVTVAFTVGVDGRANACSVVSPGPDPQTNALVCPLVIERIRFNPARDATGQPVPARYGWRQDFFRR